MKRKAGLFPKIILTAIVCCHFLAGSAAEPSNPVIIRGMVCNEKMVPLSGAYVIVRAADSTLLSHAVTDSLGAYWMSIPSEQKVIIESRFVGYEPYFPSPWFLRKGY